MSSKSFLAFAASGVISWVGTAGTLADERAKEERFFQSDFRTLYGCLQRMARDRNFKLQRTGGGWGWTGSKEVDQLKERFAIVAERDKLHFDDEPIIYIGDIGPQSVKRPRSQLRTIKLDPDTGDLSPPGAVQLGQLTITEINFSFDFYDSSNRSILHANIMRIYPEKAVRVEVTSKEKDGPAICRDFMASLESKLKLAAKLKEAKAKKSK
jgi:hypothetical protein